MLHAKLIAGLDIDVSASAKSSGSWDSIHVFEAQDRARVAYYKLTSTVILSLGSKSDNVGAMDLSGNMVRQVEQDMVVLNDEGHVTNIGKVRPVMRSNLPPRRKYRFGANC